MKINNKGLTLVELIVCMAIFAIVAAAAYGFMVAGANSFSSVNSNISVQMTSDTAMNQISDYIIDCNTAIGYDSTSKTLVIVSKNSTDDKYTVSIFEFRANENSIYFGSKDNAAPDLNGNFQHDFTPTDLLAKDVDSFDVDITTEAVGSTTAVSAEINAEFEYNKKTATLKRIVSLRNEPDLIS